jgi:hypothetical protein
MDGILLKIPLHVIGRSKGLNMKAEPRALGHTTFKGLFRRLISQMDVIKAVQNYVNKMIDEVPGMKVLLLDTETVGTSFLSHHAEPYAPLTCAYVFSDANSLTCCNPVESPGQGMLFD